MNKSAFTKRVMFVSIIVLVLGCPLFAQVSIEWNEIPHILNTRWTKNMAYEVSVNLGAAGGPQTWTFTSQPMGPDSCTNVVFPVNQAPFHDSFPNANLVYASLEGADSAFLYMELEPNFVSTLGIAGTASSGMCLMYDPVDTNNLPEHYNDTRHYYAAYTVDFGAGSYVLYEKRGFEDIDAYGTVIVPYGSYPCLRYVLFDTLMLTTYYNNVPILFDTTTSILHQFVAENYSGVVCVRSQDDETNPYFTNASILERLTYFATGIEEVTNVFVGDNSVTVSPNPFKNNVAFTYDGETTGPVIFEIYDVQGRLIRDFAVRTAGKAIINWSGKDRDGMCVPEGVYLFRVHAGDHHMIGKIVRMR
jgi:hypothetical protein